MTDDPPDDDQDQEEAHPPLSDRAAQIEVGIAAALASTAVAQQGPAGLGFLTETVPVPLWFLLAAFVLPTGELLAWLRGLIPKRGASTGQ